MQAEENDDDAGNLAEQREVLHQQGADRRGRGSQRNEDDGEAEDEGDRHQDGSPPRAGRCDDRACPSHLVQRHARYERKVARNEGQDAWRNEREDPCQKRGEQRYFLHYSTGFSLMIAGAAGRALGSRAPLIGGISWKRKSHFHRSDGFDCWSQWRADTGLPKFICWSAP